jgi:hypothetical protein
MGISWGADTCFFGPGSCLFGHIQLWIFSMSAGLYY